jgi:hypothetical protein
MINSQFQPSHTKPLTRTTEPRVRVQRHSPHRLLRRPVVLIGGVKIAAEKHRGRIVIRIELPSDVDKLGDSARPPGKEIESSNV